MKIMDVKLLNEKATNQIQQHTKGIVYYDQVGLVSGVQE